MELYITLVLTLGISLAFSNIGFCFQQNRVTDYLAKISLPIYIFHYTVIRIITYYYPTKKVDMKTFVLLFILTITSSILMMYITDITKKVIKSYDTLCSRKDM